MGRTQHLVRSEAQLEDPMLMAELTQHVENLVRVLPIKLQHVAEEEPEGWNRWNLVREPVPQPEFHVRGKPEAGEQCERYQHGFTNGVLVKFKLFDLTPPTYLHEYHHETERGFSEVAFVCSGRGRCLYSTSVFWDTVFAQL